MRKGIRLLSGVVSDISTPICRRSGFIHASLILDWEKIISPAFSQFCQALRITFPKGQKTQGALHVRAPSSMALALSYQEPEILERVNRYYGYQAVVRLVIHQGHIPKQRKEPLVPSESSLDPQRASRIEDLLTEVPGESLKNALKSLGMSVIKEKT